MKHIKKLLPLVALLSLTSCGESQEQTIEMTKKEAIAVVSEANQKTLESAGLAISSATNAQLNVDLKGLDENSVERTATITANASLNLGMEVMLNDSIPTALKMELEGSAGYQMSLGEYAQESSVTMSLGAYLKGYTIYGQAKASSTNNHEEVELFNENGKVSVFDLIDAINDSISGTTIQIPGFTLNAEMVEAINGFKEVIKDALPEPIAVQKGDELTITYKLVQADVVKLIEDVSTYITELMSKQDAPVYLTLEEESSVPVIDQEVINQLLPIVQNLNLNELSLSTTIKNGLISKLETKLDLGLSETEIDGVTASGQFVLNRKIELSVLTKDHQIVYPEGMENWKKYPDNIIVD